MDEIKNSPFRERYRKEAEEKTKKKIADLYQEQDKECTELLNKIDAATKNSAKAAGSDAKMGYILTCAVVGAVIGAVVSLFKFERFDIYGVIVWVIVAAVFGLFTSGAKREDAENNAWSQGSQNKKKAIEDLKKKHTAQVDQLRAEGDAYAAKLIKAYEEKVNKYAQQMMMQESKLQGIIDWQLKMMEKAIAKVPKGEHMKFVETSLSYEVTETRISYYIYSSNHPNSSDDCIFSMYGLPNQTADYQKEGFAQAITKLTMLHIIQGKKPDSVKMKVGHQDAKVRIAYKEMLF